MIFLQHFWCVSVYVFVFYFYCFGFLGNLGFLTSVINYQLLSISSSGFQILLELQLDMCFVFHSILCVSCCLSYIYISILLGCILKMFFKLYFQCRLSKNKISQLFHSYSEFYVLYTVFFFSVYSVWLCFKSLSFCPLKSLVPSSFSKKLIYLNIFAFYFQLIILISEIFAGLFLPVLTHNMFSLLWFHLLVYVWRCSVFLEFHLCKFLEFWVIVKFLKSIGIFFSWYSGGTTNPGQLQIKFCAWGFCVPHR